VAPHRLGLVYCESMMEHVNESQLNHVESPKRISAIFDRHQEFDLLKRCHMLKVVIINAALIVSKFNSFHYSLPEFRRRS